MDSTQPDGPAATTRRGPALTVGVPVFEGERFLERTLTALRDQDLADVEVIVADNGSTDRSAAIADAFAAADPRFRVLRSDRNRGVPWNWNRVLAEASAPYFMWNGADDVVRPAHLARCRAALEERPDATIAFSRVALVDVDDRLVGEMDDDGLDLDTGRPSQRARTFLARHAYQVIGFGGVHRTDVLRRMGGLPAYYGGDVALGVAMALRAPWVLVPEQLFVSRRHDQQTNKVQGGDVLDQVRTYDPGFSRPVAFPQWELLRQLFAACLTAPVPAAERARAVDAVVREWAVPNWRFYPYDVKRNLVRLVRGRYAGAYHSGSGSSGRPDPAEGIA
ncbi:glycosyltransferase family 2 protein [Isoptericola sp. NPDC057191]|uniref:glycosyltransferase family 2 protein n=1 Tax=Isoptericola sp. NPDC057191 TaxID=3346041 RepID=UPI00363E2CEA